jgi:hypothetical protein
MRSLRFSFATLALLSLAAINTPAAAPAARPVYELRIYEPAPGKYDALLTRFREHTLGIFSRLGMTNVVYWNQFEPAPEAGGKLVYLLAHPSREAAKEAWAKFREDPEWRRARDQSELGGKLTRSVESIFLEATDYTAAMDSGAGAPGRIIEMRTYRTLPGRLTPLDARFRDHTRRLFAKHGMTNLGYFHPLDEAKGAGTTLIYFLAHASREAAKASWAAFNADPEWTAVRTASQVDGPFLQPKGITSAFLTPTDFSPIK